MPLNWSDAGPGNALGGRRRKQPRLNDIIPIHKFTDGETSVFRPIGPAYVQATHWIKIKTKDSGVKSIPKRCMAVGIDGNPTGDDCPFCALDGGGAGVVVLQNAISRDKQNNPPKVTKKPTKEEMQVVPLPWAPKTKGRLFLNNGKGAKTASNLPVVVLEIKPSIAKRIMAATKVNVKSIKDPKTGKIVKKVFGPEHPKRGFDISIHYNASAAPADMYYSEKDQNTALTDEELKYPIFRLDLLPLPTLEEAKKDAKFIKERMVKSKENDDEYQAAVDDGDAEQSEEEETKAKKAKAGKPGKAKAGGGKAGSVNNTRKQREVGGRRRRLSLH